MARLLIEDVEVIQEMGRSGDRDELQHRGHEPYTSEAVPHYVAWIREDVCGILALLAFIADDLRWIRRCAMALVVICACAVINLYWR